MIKDIVFTINHNLCTIVISFFLTIKSIGGQSTLKLDLGGNVNVRFKNSDLCPEKFSLGQSPKYSTKILWICSSIEVKMNY